MASKKMASNARSDALHIAFSARKNMETSRLEKSHSNVFEAQANELKFCPSNL